MPFFNSSNPVVDIGISMTLKDNFSNPSKDILKSWRDMSENINTFSQGMTRAFENSMSRQVGILKGMYSTFEHSAKIDKNLFLTNKMINDSINHSKELLQLSKEINLKNPLNLEDITSGTKFMAMAGMNYDTIAKSIKPAADMAAIFNHELGGKGGTADLMTNIMATFNLAANEATNVADILSVGTTSANMGLDDLAQTVKYLGANARLAGLDLKEVTTIAGVLGNRGLQGSMAGTNTGQALVQMIQGVAGTNQKAAAALKQLGLGKEDLKDANGNLLKLDEILTKIGLRMQGMGNVQRTGIFQDLFGRRGTRAANILIEDLLSGNSQYQAIMTKLNSSAGFTAKTMDEYMENESEAAIRRLASAWDNFYYTVGASLKTTLAPIFNGLATTLSWIEGVISSNPIASWVVPAFTIVTAFKLFRNFVGYTAMGMKAITTNMLTTSTTSQKVATNMKVANDMALQYEHHLRNITILMSQMVPMRVGQKIDLVGGSLTMGKDKVRRINFAPTNPGKGEAYFNNSMGMFGMPVIGYNPAAVGAAAGAGGVSGVRSNYNAGAGHLARSIRSAMPKFTSTSIIMGMTKAIFPVTRILTSLFGFLSGPWGMAIMMGMTFLPQIGSLLGGLFKSNEDLKAKDEKRRQDEAIRRGETHVNISLNGRSVGTVPMGGSLNIDEDYGDWYDNGMGGY